MGYKPEDIARIAREHQGVTGDLQRLLLRCVEQGQANPNASEHLQHGAGRRVSVLRRAVERIFTLFPLDTRRPLAKDTLTDVQINLHAFVINLSGVFDNLAWAFVARHDLHKQLPSPRSIGIFIKDTQRFLPKVLRDYVSSETMTKWRDDYLKNYRDALAHRIPLYIPPAQFTNEEGQRYNELEREKVESIRAMKWDRLEEIYAEQAALGAPSFMFLHSYAAEGAPRPILLHPQILSDAKTVIEFCELYFRNWHAVERPIV